MTLQDKLIENKLGIKRQSKWKRIAIEIAAAAAIVAMALAASYINSCEHKHSRQTKPEHRAPYSPHDYPQINPSYNGR